MNALRGGPYKTHDFSTINAYAMDTDAPTLEQRFSELHTGDWVRLALPPWHILNNEQAIVLNDHISNGAKLYRLTLRAS